MIVNSRYGQSHRTRRNMTRAQAMQKWNKLDVVRREDITAIHYPKRKHTSLTGHEIQIMIEKQTNI